MSKFVKVRVNFCGAYELKLHVINVEQIVYVEKDKDVFNFFLSDGSSMGTDKANADIIFNAMGVTPL